MQLIDLQFGDVWRVYVGKIHTRAATLRRCMQLKGLFHNEVRLFREQVKTDFVISLVSWENTKKAKQIKQSNEGLA